MDPHDETSTPAAERPPSPFALIAATVLSVYFAAMAFLQGRDAVAAADHALARGLWILFGAALIVAFCLLVRFIDQVQSQRSRGAGPGRGI